ncbi:MAG TPA: hypothetical protein VIP98_07380 [Microlunatus sp.]
MDGRADLLESGQRWCQVGALKALLDSQGVAVLIMIVWALLAQLGRYLCMWLRDA